ncbi:MAG: hypothetical protein KatS3mg121_0800 [Gammaproteobacteria bacterium]|nr:MAG: hypothetical protein KatS3mg121_0800 [Gammaproteobacteria bacterium]
MRATAEIQVIPLGVGVSLRRHVQQVVAWLREFPLRVEPHPNGTNLEGELADVLAAAGAVHERLHAEGVVRVLTQLKLETRSDKPAALDDKRL